MTILTVLLIALGGAWGQGADRQPTVRVFIYTATGSATAHTPEELGRLEAVQDVRDALARKKGVTIVGDRGSATVVIEVVGREQRDGPDGGFGGKAITRMGDAIIRLHVTSGDDDADLKGIGQGTWGRAAKDAADRVLKWIARREPKKTTGQAPKNAR